jgi:hypothetical protein
VTASGVLNDIVAITTVERRQMPREMRRLRRA